MKLVLRFLWIFAFLANATCFDSQNHTKGVLQPDTGNKTLLQPDAGNQTTQYRSVVYFVNWVSLVVTEPCCAH